MKFIFSKLNPFFYFLILVCLSSCCGKSDQVDTPGNIFIRQKVKSIPSFRKTFFRQSQNLKTHGFSAYSLHRDLKDPQTIILTLKCSSLAAGVSYIRSSKFMSAIDNAGVRIPTVWYGLDSKERQYSNQPRMTGGIVIARNEVRDYPFWLNCFFKEDGGKHNHPDRKYKNTNYSIHHLPGDPAVAIVVHEASDVSKAPAFMASDAMNGEMEATGVIGLEIWYGINLEEGFF